jgi:uncharacterized OB-fold protein
MSRDDTTDVTGASTRPPAPWPMMLPDRDSAPWWDALGRHELVAQRCGACGTWRWPLRAICGRCGSFDATVEVLSGRATVASFVVNHHAFSPLVEPPYVVVLARLDEQDDICIPGAWGGAQDGSDLTIGAPLRVDFDDVVEPDGREVTLIRWRAG